MKRFFSVAILVMAIGGAVNLHMANTNKSVFSVYSSNIVALTSESNGSYCRWKLLTCQDGTVYESCQSNGNGNGCICEPEINYCI